MSLIGLLGFRVRERRVARGVVCACTLALLATASSFAGERELEDAPPPTSIEEIEASLEQAYPEPKVRPSLFPWVRRQVQRLPRFLEDSQLQLRYRTYYLRQDRVNDVLSEAWAMGGSLYYRSGWVKDLFSVELEGFTSQPIVAPNSRDGTFLLNRGQDGFSVLGVANGKLRYRDYVLTGFRQTLDLPYLNRQDNRMVPNTFEAAKLAKEKGPLRFAAGYAWNFKGRNDDDFESLSNRVGVSKDRGAAFGALLWKPSETLHIGASGFVVPDLFATVYSEAHYDPPLTDVVGLRLDAQFTHQHSVGKELLAGGSFDTWNFGLRTSVSRGGALLRLAFVVTDDERRIQSFYGSNPSYVNLMQRTFNRADEKGFLISLAYDFSKLGIANLKAVANFAQGWDAKVAGRRRDTREFDCTIDYRVGRGRFESLWLRLRGSWHDEDATPQDGTDFRVILRYELPVI